ncbi:dihydroorotate dehydrogenase [Clostridium sp. MSJ-11]|uniref:Dihydroorotate dehydrogenase n=1 Tax=Clostridium mobile TaxID=2841512 RepID=A0ABS6EEP3_9CLOT|nr:dihydroorotate dehydrogenase [Clostridium mobile]MBU5483668.1 dihydroorotate dehydrogenase [Clostridium mobile]
MIKPNLQVQLGGVTLKNPVMPASGTFGSGNCDLIDIRKIGAIVPKSVTLTPREGNNTPRIAETTGGVLNSIGIQSEGLEYFIKNDLKYYEQYDTPIIVSISAYSVDEFLEMVEILNKEKSINMIELNISCPNLKEGGKAFGMSEEFTYKIVKEVKNVTNKVIIPKLTPNVADIVSIALAAEEGGADCLCVANTHLGMAIDVKSRKPRLGNIIGGLSGPAIKPISLRMVWQVAQKVGIPIIGVGGISNWEDAIEYILAGATAIQVGTYNFVNPNCMIDIVEGIEKYMIENNYFSIKELIGSVEI